MKHDNNHFFWPSFVDLLTGLFVVMLVLFVLSYKLLSEEKNKVYEKLKHYEEFTRIEKQISALDSSGYFVNKCGRHVLKIDIMFDPNQSVILEPYKDSLGKSGIFLKRFIDSLLNMYEGKIKFLVVIEGNAANTYDNKYPKDSNYGYKLSYDRALALYNLWRNYTDFYSTQNDRVEILIAGSGFSGLCRETIEEKNKRFILKGEK